MFDNIETAELIKALHTFLCAAVIAAIATPFVKKLAVRIGAVDVPKDERRVHHKPMPLMGGLAIYLAFLVAVLIFSPLTKQLIGMLIGATIIVITGVIDDRFVMDAKIKFLCQIVAAVIPICCGVRIELLTNFLGSSSGPHILLDTLSIPLTLFWIVGMCNAVNLIDGLDGLACGVSSIASFSIFLILVQKGDPVTALLIAALAGACIGFLPYNFNPAKIFMGDTGALFLGFVLATVSIMGEFKWFSMVSFGLPFLVLGLPIFDTLFSIIRRLIHGKKPWEADRGHIHHRLIDLGMSQKQAVAILYAISAVLGLSANLLTHSNLIKLIIMGVVFLISAVAAVRLYITHERHLKEQHMLQSGQKTEEQDEQNRDNL